MATRFVFIIFIVLTFSAFAQAQDSLSFKDVQEIRYKAALLVRRELQDLLNNIAQPGFDSKETEEIILNSYAGNSNKIFESDKARIENDLNPKMHNSNTSSDIDVIKYLKDFDLLYTKTDNFSIAFSDIKASQVKKASYIYVKVYFASFFNNKYKGVEGETAYTLNNRVAEIKLINDNGKWTPYILRIGFAQPADTLHDIVNDIPIKKEPGQFTSEGIDSSTAASIDAEIEAKKRKQLIDEENGEIQKFNTLINEGDKALGENNFTDALNYYRQAKELMPYDPLPRSKITKANKLQVSTNITKDQLFDQYIDNARLATRKREYEDAIRLYRLALDNKPAEKNNLQTEIETLTKKVNFLTEMNLNYKAGNYKEAIKQYSAAIKKKKDSDYFLGRARSYFKTGDYEDAMNDFTAAYETDNENLAALEGRADLHRFLGDALLKAKKNDEKKEHYIKALTDYTAYLTLNKKNTRIYEYAAEIQVLLYNNVDDAIKALDAGLDADSKAKPLYIKKGLLLMQKKDFRKADINFSTALKIDSNDALAYYNRGVCQLNFNNITAAAADFDNARKKQLDTTSLKNIAAYARGFFEGAENNFKANAKDSAVLLIDYAIAIDPHNSLYHYTRGGCYSSLNNYKEAIAAYDQAIQYNNNYTDAYYKRGLDYYRLHIFKTAIENFNKASIANYAQLFLVQKALGDTYLALLDYSNAISNFEKSIKTAGALKNDPPANIIAEIYNGLSKSHFGQQAFDKSIECGKTAVKKNNAFAEAYFNLGMAYYRSGKLQDAIDNIGRAVSLDDKKLEWRYELARCQHINSDFLNALNNYTLVIAADSTGKLKEVLYYRGLAGYQSGNYAAALPDYQHCKTSGADSLFTSFYYELGNIYLNLGKYDSAAICYQHTLSTEAGNGSAMYGMGSALFLKGNTNEALGWFEKSFQTKTINAGEIKKDKLIAGLRNEKNFKTLMKKYF